MSQETIKCPKCGEIIKLSEAISQDMEITIKAKYEKEFDQKLVEERKQLQAQARKMAQESISMEFADLKEQLAEKSKKLEETQKQEIEVRKRERQVTEKEELLKKELDEKEKELKEQFLEEKKLIEKKIRSDVESAQKSQFTDLQEQLVDKSKRLEKAQQQELELRKQQRQLEDDKRAFELEMNRKLDIERQNIAEKVARESEENHKFKDAEKDKQLTDIPSALSLSLALRVTLIQVTKSREIQTGKEEKKEVVFNYLTGVEFRNRVQAIVESFVAMKKDLDAEKRAITAAWSKREKQIEKVVLNIAGMHGDLEGIVGESLPAVKMLELPTESEERQKDQD